MTRPTRNQDGDPQLPPGARYLLEREDRIAWIMGSSRSGSTWLLRMLADLESVVGINDPHLGHHLGVWRPLPLAWGTANERPELGTLLEVKRGNPDFFFSDRYRETWLPALRSLIAARFGAQISGSGVGAEEPATLVVKEPGSQAAELLFEAFPQSRLIFLLRDGRDVVDSWLDAYRRGSWAIDQGAYDVDPDRRLPLVEWLATVWAYRTRAVAEVFDRLVPEQRVMVRYEDLLADPEARLGQVCARLGIAAPRSALAEIAAARSMAQIEPEDRGPLQEARVAEPGGWRRNLAADEQRSMHEIMGPELARFGYLPGDESEAAA